MLALFQFDPFNDLCKPVFRVKIDSSKLSKYHHHEDTNQIMRRNNVKLQGEAKFTAVKMYISILFHCREAAQSSLHFFRYTFLNFLTDSNIILLVKYIQK